MKAGRRVAGTCEQHASSEHLSQDAASSPHVDGLGVVVGGQEEAGGAVPLGHQTFGQIALRCECRRERGGGGRGRGRQSRDHTHTLTVQTHLEV